MCDQLLIRSGHSPLSVTPSDRKLLIRGGGEILFGVCQLAQQVADDTETQTVSARTTQTETNITERSEQQRDAATGREQGEQSLYMNDEHSLTGRVVVVTIVFI